MQKTENLEDTVEDMNGMYVILFQLRGAFLEVLKRETNTVKGQSLPQKR